MNKLKTVNHVKGSEYLIKSIPYEDINTILDVGIGDGYASKEFLSKGLRVTGIGLNINQYLKYSEIKKHKQFNYEETTIENFKTSQKFDAIYMSHVIEHLDDPGSVLKKIKKMLKEDGWLFIMVPPYKSKIVGGHTNTGWSLGQLIFVLTLAGFDTRKGHYITYGYNLCAFVRNTYEKKEIKLNYDKGDIEILIKNKKLPEKITTEPFEGYLAELNWNKLKSNGKINIKKHKAKILVLKKYRELKSLILNWQI